MRGLREECKHVAGALDVDPRSQLARDREVVDSGEVIRGGELPPEAHRVISGEHEAGLRDVAHRRREPSPGGGQARFDRVQLAAGHVQEALLDEAHERLLGRQLQQARQQPRADEAREAREQHAHDFPSRVMIRQTSRMLVAR